MWKIHGKYYDLTLFLDKHPGGSKILECCKGVDCTAAFESYHAMSNMGKINNIMRKYEIDIQAPDGFKEHTITFSENGFYNEVRKRVKKHMMTTKNYKWSWSWLSYAVATFILFILSHNQAFCQHNNPFYIRCFYCVISSTSLIQCLFQIYHDASHMAISKNKYVNEYICLLGSGLAYWDYSTWTKHHSILHHSFTGDYDNDPDTKHANPFIKKHSKSKRQTHKIISSNTAISLIFSIFPGMYFGQIVSYLIAQYRKKLWGFKINTSKTLVEWIIIFTQTLIMIRGESISLVMLYFLTLNINYSIAILPDHDLYETHLNHNNAVTDWGELQVRHSGNFATNNWLYTRLYGGINYQIEHHLFPSICSYHLPEVAIIVKEVCNEYDIKYVISENIFMAYFSAIKNIALINE